MQKDDEFAPVCSKYFPLGHLIHAVSEGDAVRLLYVPDGHNRQAALPRTDLNLPAPHAAHSVPSLPVYPSAQLHAVILTLPGSDDISAGHALHTDDPVSSLYCPAGHGTHGKAPADCLNFPRSQALQISLSPGPASTKPGMQLQFALEVAPPSEVIRHGHGEQAPTAPALYDPASQSMQSDDPAVFLYFPGVQAVHCPPLSPENPTLQEQLVRRLLPGWLFEKSGHFLQSEDPKISEYVPSLQGMHEEDPTRDLKVPGIQGSHRAASAPT